MRRKPRGYSVSRAVLNIAHWFLLLSIPQVCQLLILANALARGPFSFWNNETSKGLFNMPVSNSYPAPTDPVLIMLVNVDENATFRHPVTHASIAPPGN